MSERAERIGRNEAIFRQVNERLGEVNAAFSSVSEQFTIVCECGDLSCTEQLAISPSDYEQVRADAALFVVLPGHEDAAVEEAVERHEEYVVLRKHPGEPERIAEDFDPRSN